MKIFSLNDCDWYIGESLEACKQDYMKFYGDDYSLLDEAYELSDEELDTLKYIDTDEDERPLGTDRTFREQLEIEINKGGEFPRLFASTEF